MLRRGWESERERQACCYTSYYRTDCKQWRRLSSEWESKQMPPSHSPNIHTNTRHMHQFTEKATIYPVLFFIVFCNARVFLTHTQTCKCLCVKWRAEAQITTNNYFGNAPSTQNWPICRWISKDNQKTEGSAGRFCAVVPQWFGNRYI